MSQDQVRARAMGKPTDDVEGLRRQLAYETARGNQFEAALRVTELYAEKGSRSLALARDVAQALEEENTLLSWLLAESEWLRKWTPRKGDWVTGKVRNDWEADPVGVLDSFAYDDQTAVIEHVPPRNGSVRSATYVDRHTLRPATPVRSEPAPVDTWTPAVGERVTAKSRASTTEDLVGEYGGRVRDTARIRVGWEWRYVDAETVRPAPPSEPTGGEA